MLLACAALVARPAVDGAVVFRAGVFARMGEFGSPPEPWMIPHLRRGLWHPVGAVRYQAAEGLWICSELACTHILIAEARRTSDPMVWAVAARSWPEQVSRRDLWEPALAGGRVVAAAGVASALAVEGRAEDAPLCLELSRATRNREIMGESMTCLAHIATPETVDRLIEMMEDGDETMVRKGLRVLPNVDSPKAAEAFERFMGVDRNAILGLVDGSASWTKPLLLALARDPEHPQRDRAVGVLQKYPHLRPSPDPGLPVPSEGEILGPPAP